LPDWTVCGAGKICDGKGACADVKAAKQMVYVPGGTFWMGCNSAKDTVCGPEPASSEKPQHQVTLGAYYLDVFEVSTTQWQACAQAGKCTAPDAGCSAPAVGNWLGSGPKTGRESHPVNCVNWAQADAYCKWRGGALPTEAQWEMAARGSCEQNGGATVACKAGMRVYPWGDATATCAEAQMFEGGAGGCGALTTAAVGSKGKGASPYGVMDMAGNVWEWVADWYLSSYDAGAVADPAGPATATARLGRGGGFANSSSNVRSSERSANLPTFFDYDIGLRCARPYP
jgi:formylglycine-generating enzyme required for sulfatase activity